MRRASPTLLCEFITQAQHQIAGQPDEAEVKSAAEGSMRRALNVRGTDKMTPAQQTMTEQMVKYGRGERNHRPSANGVVRGGFRMGPFR